MYNGFEMEITSYCQARCRSCKRTNSETGEVVDWLTVQHVPLEKIKAVIDGINDQSGVEQIVLCGEYGDPMMHPDISEIIDYITSRFTLCINTNGGLRNSEFYSSRAKNRNLKFAFSIDGLDAETNEKYREGVDFDRAWENMHSWFRHGGRGRWDWLIFDWNYHQLFLAFGYAINCNIPFRYKFNIRPHGLITEENKQKIMPDIIYLGKLLWDE
jgi:molybdenum cofactor biosynthesis enzyme MoaA